MNNIAAKLTEIKQQIASAEQAAHRPAGSVKLLAVTKNRSIAEINTAFAAGQHMFAESYLQEALTKIQALEPAIAAAIEWHFIGTIQANKTRKIAENFAWVHSVNHFKIARRLSEQRPPTLAPLNVCIEVNIDQEEKKSGITLTELPELAQAIKALPHLKLRGLMTIPKPQTDFVQQRLPFQQLRQAFEQLNQTGFHLDTLSMGMSNDFVAAIMEGSTIVRIGTALWT